MRKVILVGFFSLVVSVLLAAPAAAAFQASVSISAFHDTLAPHGRWIVTRSYGEVWVPAGIDASWQPYWNGEWVWTDYGWTWVSYDPWGDIPFHYGTWTWVDGDGWAWIPGTVWAPAWVTWAWTDNCVGWAPVPATFALSATGYFGSPVVVPASRYVFVPANQFVASPVQQARFPSSRNAAFLASARTATRFSVSGGVVHTTADPPPAFVQKATGRQLQRVSIEHARTHPTALAATSHTGHIGVVAPARERASMNARNAATERTTTGRNGPASAKARVASARHSGEPAASSASVRHGTKSSGHTPVRIETNSRTGSRTVTNTGSASASRSGRSATRNVSKSSGESVNAKRSTHGRSAGSAEATASRTRSAPAHEPARKAETHAPAAEARASSSHAAPAQPQANRHEAHAAPAEHPAPHAAPPARQAPPPPKQPKQHPPKPKDKDQEHS